jgi:hypothetical protein
MPADEGNYFINIHHIVRVDGISDDQVVLHTSDGQTNTLCGSKEALKKLLTLLAEHAMTVDGRPLMEVLAESRHKDLKDLKRLKGLKLVKREPEPGGAR